MFFSPRKDYFALNFSESKIRVLKLDDSGKKALACGEVEIAPGIIVEGHIKDKSRLLESIKNLLQKIKIKEKFVIIGLPEDQAFVRTLTLPDLPPEEINQAIRWQADSLLPLPFEKVCLDWRLISRINKKKLLLLVAVEKELVDRYVEVVSAFSLKPVAFEIRSLSLARLVKKAKQISLVVEIEDQEATLAIVQSPETLVLSSALKGDFLKNNDELLQLILQMISFYQKRHQVDKKPQIFVTGEKADQQIVSQISQKTNCQSFIFSPKLNGFDPQKALSFASTVALANKPVAAPINEETVNLLPPQIQRAYDQAAKRKRIISWLKTYSFFFLFFLLVFALCAFRLLKLSSNFSVEIAQREAIRASLEQKKFQLQAQKANQKSKMVLQLFSQRLELTKILSELSSAIPQGIVLSHLSFEEKNSTLILEGRASSRDLLLQFRKRLEEKECFSQAEIPLTSLEKKENFPFTLVLALRKK